MFEGFVNVWTPVTRAKRLGRKPLAVELAGERLVFFRGSGGRAAALVDRCPHRGVKLSLGTVAPDGCLECPFHAWRFDGDGRVREVPLNPDARLAAFSAQRVPVRELGGLLWAFTRVGDDPAESPAVPEALVDERLARTYVEVDWDAHWSRAMENMLDSPHVPFVHRRTIGRAVRPLLGPRSQMTVRWEETDRGFRATSSVDGRPEAEGGTLEFVRPNLMALDIPIPGKVFRIHAACVPIGERRTRMILIGARSFARSPLLNPLFNWVNRRIAEEDRPVVESSDPSEVPPPGAEASVATDRVTLHFRKYYLERMRGSTSGPTNGAPRGAALRVLA